MFPTDRCEANEIADFENVEFFLSDYYKFYISKTKYLLEKIGRSTKEIRKENVLAKNNSHSARFEVFSAVLVSLKSSGT